MSMGSITTRAIIIDPLHGQNVELLLYNISDKNL